MVSIFDNGRFYPRHFFVKKESDEDIKHIIKEISEKASGISPESFDAEIKYFIYKFNYQPPYVKISDFNEIRNLQKEAISKTRFKEEYNGYIGLDITEWAGHANEEHFINSVAALYMMSYHWKFVFFADASADERDIQDILDVIRKGKIWVKELNCEVCSRKRFSVRISDELKNSYGMSAGLEGVFILDSVFGTDEGCCDDIAICMAEDMAVYFDYDKTPLDKGIVTYLSDENTYAQFIMLPQEKEAVCNLKEERRAENEKMCG